MKCEIPSEIGKALATIRDYCRKQSSCKECPLEGLCGIAFRFPPSTLPKALPKLEVTENDS